MRLFLALGFTLIVTACGGGSTSGGGGGGDVAETGVQQPAGTAPAPAPTQSAPCSAKIYKAEVASLSNSIDLNTEATHFSPSAHNGDTVLCQGYLNGMEIFRSDEIISNGLATCGGLRQAQVLAGDTFKVKYTWKGNACSASTSVAPNSTPISTAPKLTCGGDRSPGTTIPSHELTVATVTLTNGSVNTAAYTLRCNGNQTETGTRTLGTNGRGTLNIVPVNEGCANTGDTISVTWAAQGLNATCSWPIMASPFQPGR